MRRLLVRRGAPGTPPAGTALPADEKPANEVRDAAETHRMAAAGAWPGRVRGRNGSQRHAGEEGVACHDVIPAPSPTPGPAHAPASAAAARRTEDTPPLARVALSCPVAR